MRRRAFELADGGALTVGSNVVVRAIKNDDGTTKLPGASFYLFFAGFAIVASLIFAVIAIFYRDNTQKEDVVTA